MPIFEVEHNGQVYEVDAPDIQQAAAAAQSFSAAPPPAAPTDWKDMVPTPGDPLPGFEAPATPAESPSMWDRIKTAKTGDPVLDMLLYSIPKAFKGAPEVAMNTVGNAGVQAVAGLTAPFVSESPDDAANFIRDFTAENSMQPRGESAQELTAALGDALAPVQNIKEGLGEAALGATGSPDIAATADMLPDFLMTVLGVPKATKPASQIDTARRTRFDVEAPGAPGAAADPSPPVRVDDDPMADLSGARERLPDVEGPVTPMVGDLRAADIRLRPSDVRAMAPGAKKVPGEFRERFADGPDLKRDMTLHNQQRMTQLAAEEIGAKALDEGSLTKAEAPAAATYDMVENVLRDRPMSEGFQSVFREAAASAKMARGEQYTVTRLLGALRRRASKRMQSDDVKTEEAGFADRDLADRLEDALGEELRAAGEPQLLKEYQDARQLFAKVNDVRTATRAEQIDANVLRRLQEKTGKLTGRLKLVADAAEYAPNVTGHSLKTAAREGQEIAGSREGMVKEFLKGVVRKVPGMNVGAESFQKTLGLPSEARAASYGRPTDIAPSRGPEQGGLDLREVLELDTPGVVGRPERAPRELGPQPDMLGEMLDLSAPEGSVGVRPPGQMTLQELLGLGEPLTLTKPPGRTPSKLRSTESAPGGLTVSQDFGGAPMRAATDVAESGGMRMSAANEPDLSMPARSETQNQAAALLDAISNPAGRNPRLAVSKAADSLALRAAELPRPVRLALQNLREVMAESQVSPNELLDAHDEMITMLRQYIGE